MKQHGWALVLALALVGCSDDEGAGSSAYGKVGGHDFEVVSALVDYSRSDSNEFAIDLYGTTVSCSASGSSLNRVLLTVPRQQGDHAIGDGVTTATFVLGSDGGRRFIAQGRVQIGEISSSQVRGGLRVHFDGANRLDGPFAATICQ